MTPESRAGTAGWIRKLACALIASVLAPTLAAAEFVPSSIRPPAVPREFRGVWVASVKNIDWPSRPGLSAAQQKSELLLLLDRCAQLRLNAVLLQVRPACDALYESALEPWSEYLTGTMGRGPGYDPLAFAVAEAHRRGLELHAWLNPFRARHASATGAVWRTHVSRTQPALVRRYGKSLWLDPGERAAHDYSVQVVLDVARRYDVDGIHFDDYFYPYEEKDSQGRALPFPDEPSWKRYGSGGGKLAREDWRRENVNVFIHRVQAAVHAQKAWVKFGISPFGIWRPGHPASVRGLDAYEQLHADSRRWLAEGWVDYLAPQLYWPASAPEQSFPALLQWWTEQNARQRNLWPGIAHANSTEEIVRQIQITRKQPGASGEIHWSMKSLLNSQRGAADALAHDVYAQPALVPAFPWLNAAAPPAPTLRVSSDGASGGRATWAAAPGEAVWLWALQSRTGAVWRTEIFPGSKMSCGVSRAEAVALSAVNRFGNTSAAVVLERSTAGTPKR